jgi:hypothetical protein
MAAGEERVHRAGAFVLGLVVLLAGCAASSVGLSSC